MNIYEPVADAEASDWLVADEEHPDWPDAGKGRSYW